MDTKLTIDHLAGVPVAAASPLDDQPKRSELTPKVRKALELMVYAGMPRDEAAKEAGLQQNGIYKAFRKPAVKAAYLAMCEELRLSYRARGIHRMAEVQEQSVNLNAAVAAYKALNNVTEDVSRSNAGLAQSPGFLITIVNTSPSQPAISGHERVIEQKPNDINGSGSHQLERPTDAIGRPR